jgi:hypothetical protein
MASYKKTETVGGAWVKAKDLVSGVKCKLVAETNPSESVWEGKTIKNNASKIRFAGQEGEAMNVNVNKPSINALVDAFGEDSKLWIGKLLTAHTEKMLVGGKRVTALYLIPEGYEIAEDEGGYLVINSIAKIEPPANIKRTLKPEEGEADYPTPESEGIDLEDPNNF